MKKIILLGACLMALCSCTRKVYNNCTFNYYGVNNPAYNAEKARLQDLRNGYFASDTLAYKTVSKFDTVGNEVFERSILSTTINKGKN